MTTNNVYNRTFKTKREEYEEKLNQRNDNEPWIFANNFGQPGEGPPLEIRMEICYLKFKNDIKWEYI